MGEQEVEIRKEYEEIRNSIFSIYPDLIKLDNIIDMTVPKLSETVAGLKHIQQDCLIMKEAKAVITIGIGGNFCLAQASESNHIGYRNDSYQFCNILYNKPESKISNDFNKFISDVAKATNTELFIPQPYGRLQALKLKLQGNRL